MADATPEELVDDMRSKGTLVECIAYAQETFGSLTFDKTAKIKLKTGGEYTYEYLSEGALMARVRAVLSPLGVAVLVSVESSEDRSGGVTTIRVSMTFAKGTERETVYGEARGIDDRDKGYNKAVTSAVRLILTKTFLQGGDIDPEQTLNEPTSRLPNAPEKLSGSRIKALVKKAVDSKVTTPDGAVDPVLLCRIASYVGGTHVKRIDEIPGHVAEKMTTGAGTKNDVPALDAFAANRASGLDAIIAKEQENGW